MSSFFLISNGELHFDGGGHTVEVDENCLADPITVSGLSFSCFYARLVFITKGLFTMRSTVVNVTNDWVTIIHVKDQGKVELRDSYFTGQPFQVALFDRVTAPVIVNCTAEHLRQHNKIPRPFDGYVYSFISCEDVQLTDGLIADVDAGTLPFELDLTKPFETYKDRLGGFGAPVYMQNCTRSTFNGVKFDNNSGFLAGGVFSMFDRESNNFQNCKFQLDNFTIPLERVIPYLQKMEILPSDPITGVMAVLCNNTMMLGNDVTRLNYKDGDIPITMTGVCSDSKEPHYRNMFSGENFSWCDPSKGADSKLKLIIALLCSILGSAAVLTLIGVLCCCCPAMREKLTDMVHKVTNGGGK